jgi:hypothetical protein
MSPFTSESQARAKGRHYQVIGKAIHVQHCLVMAPNRTAGDGQRVHAVFAHVAEGHHFHRHPWRNLIVVPAHLSQQQISKPQKYCPERPEHCGDMGIRR